jgi:hypothetical protein
MKREGRLLANALGTMMSRRNRELLVLIGILLVGSLHGLVYLSLMPPWQYHEEPSHFEYAWLIASQHELPDYPAYDQPKRREIAASMVEHNFYRGMNLRPNLLAPPDRPVHIGINVTGALPLYHIMVAIPLSVIPHAGVDTQLYLSRFVSLGFLLGTIGMSYLIMGELFPNRRVLRLGLPLGLALLPGFLDLMTAVNNDVGATFVFSLFLWLSLRLILHGVSLRRGLLAGLAAGLCIVTKTTVFLAGPLFVLALIFAGLRRRWRSSFWLIPLVLGVAAAVIVMDWGDAAYWYRDTSQTSPISVRSPKAPWGQRAMALQVSEGRSVAQVSQPLPISVVKEVRGRDVTLGVWVWASEPAQARLIIDVQNITRDSYAIDINTEPTFYAFHHDIPRKAQRVWLILQARQPSEMSDQSLILYTDGVIATEGSYSLNVVPEFATEDGKRGTWGERTFVNLIRNPSAETRWLYIAPWVERLARSHPWSAHLDFTTLLASMLDRGYTSWLYRASLTNIVDTFWAKFGWAHVKLNATWWYQLLHFVSLLSIVGLIYILGYTGRKSQVWSLAGTWFGIACILVWTQVMFRGFTTVMAEKVFIPTARYGYPAVIPTMFFLFVGLGWLVDKKRLRHGSMVVTLLTLMVLNMVSISTIAKFYAGR